jgi:hypothetical protein
MIERKTRHDRACDGREDHSAGLFGRLGAELPAQVLTECNGIITGLVLSAIQQRHPAMSNPVEQLIHNRRDTVELDSIATAKLVPSNRIMIEPCAKRRRRGNVTKPQIDGNLSLRETTRPQPVNQQTKPVGIRRWLLDSLDHEIDRWRSRAGGSPHLRARVGTFQRGRAIS